MKIFRRLASVRAAQARARLARHALNPPAAALLTRSREHPLATVGTAAGAGFALGSLNVHPLRVPGLGALFGGGLAEALAFGMRLIAELGAVGLGAASQPAHSTGHPPDSAPPGATQ
ncbi:MAG: hypothetical protein EPN74_16425 [Rhodanobacter sp.]|nr:MAG: hypothetical protein EPN74_16425 [Rhodanobacter sp.]